jgi:hypothetical protein
MMRLRDASRHHASRDGFEPGRSGRWPRLEDALAFHRRWDGGLPEREKATGARQSSAERP